jgi:hypothetical protein
MVLGLAVVFPSNMAHRPAGPVLTGPQESMAVGIDDALRQLKV